jgi:hypothetical protein
LVFVRIDDLGRIGCRGGCAGDVTRQSSGEALESLESITIMSVRRGGELSHRWLCHKVEGMAKEVVLTIALVVPRSPKGSMVGEMDRFWSVERGNRSHYSETGE